MIYRGILCMCKYRNVSVNLFLQKSCCTESVRINSNLQLMKEET